jgi:DNA-binding phage protein
MLKRTGRPRKTNAELKAAGSWLTREKREPVEDVQEVVLPDEDDYVLSQIFTWLKLSPHSVRSIADRAGVTSTALYRFMNRTHDLGLEDVSRLAAAYGFRLVFMETGEPVGLIKPQQPLGTHGPVEVFYDQPSVE